MSSEIEISTLVLDEVEAEDEALSGFDKKLLELAALRLSPQEIASEIGAGVTPARCAQRIREILRRRDWLSQLEQQALITDDLIKLRGYLLDQMEAEQKQEPYINEHGQEIFPRSDPRWAGEMLKVLKELQRQTEVARVGQINDAMTQIRKAHAQLMVASIQLSFQEMMNSIREVYPDVEEDVLRGFIEDALPKAIEAIEAKVRK